MTVTGHKADAAVAAIEFALTTECGMEFLHSWLHGDFDVIRRDWPECPQEVFCGAESAFARNSDDETFAGLDSQEREALAASSEALLNIRMLASKPMSSAAQQTIFDLADAFHNIPSYVAGTTSQRQMNSFLLVSGLNQAQEAYKRHGLVSQYLRPCDDVARGDTNGEGQGQGGDVTSKYGHLPARMFESVFKKKDC